MKFSKFIPIRTWLPVLLVTICTTCNRVQYFPDNPTGDYKTVFLAHAGGGYFDKPNTLKAAYYGLNNLEGIECDIQMSKTGSLWLGHSPKIESCKTFEATYFASLSDNQIIEIDLCLGNNIDYYRLDSVFKYMSEKTKGKVISLDVKAWMYNISIISQMNTLGQSIIDLTSKYGLLNQVMVESETGDFLYYIKTNTTGIETYLSTNGDFELGISRALKYGFNGISFKYNYVEVISAEDVRLLHAKGLKIHLWTINDTTQINEAILLHPDYIQTDNVEYVKNIRN